jgi:hypothetical protein
MKKIIIILIITCIASLYATNTPSSIPYSGSYMQRAKGVDAIYWNPANLPNLETRAEMQILPLSYRIYNNALSIDLYNELMVDTLSQDLKDKFLNEMDGNLNVNMEFNTILFGYATKGFGLALGSYFTSYAKIDENYLNLILNGNEYDQDYVFSKKNNDMNFLAMQDITVAFGGYKLNKLVPKYLTNIPDINYGFSVSLLSGASGKMDKFNGLFKASDEGLNLNQDMTINYGGGYGFKGMLGFSSEVFTSKNQSLSMGMTFDNLLGMFSNSISCEAKEFKITADNVYVVNLDDDFYTQQDTTYSIDSFSTDLPMKFAMGFLYQYKDLSASLDISKYSKESAFGSDEMDTAFALEYDILGFMPVQFGHQFGNDSHPSVTSYGLGLRWKYWETGLGFQFYDAFAGQSSKGTSLSLQMKFRF